MGEVPYIIAKFLRPHQREGVQFVFECIAGMRQQQHPDVFKGSGCILADDMGLGKTLQSITLIYTVLTQSMSLDPNTGLPAPIAKRVIVVCPTSLVRNWENEIKKWLGTNNERAACIALSESSRDAVITGIMDF